jgi:hypothetical protein
MNNHWKIPRKTENQSENVFNSKVGLHNQIDEVSQPDNREITRLNGFHKRYRQV